MDPRIFPRTREWSERVGEWDVRQYVINNMDVSDAVVMSSLFWPGFIERSGGVFIDFLFDETSYAQWLGQLGGNVRAVEKVLNHLHLWDVFGPKSDQEYAAVSELARKIASMWRVAVHDTFHTRKFSVEISDDPEDYGPTIMLYSS
jgi:hypothetical protein